MRARTEKLGAAATPLLVSAVTVIVYVDTHSLHPFLSNYATRLGAGVFMAGAVVAAYSVFEDLFELIFGYLMDTWGRRKIFIFAGLAGDCLAMMLYALAGGPFALLGVRLFHGFSGSMAGPGIMTLVSEIPHPLARLGAKMGLYGTTIILASIIGWVLGGLLADKMGYSFFFGCMAALLLVGALLTVPIREARSIFSLPGAERPRRPGLADLLRKLKTLLRRGRLVAACLGIFSHMTTMGALTTLLPLRFEKLGLSSFHVGMTLAAYGVAALVFQIPMGYVSERYGRYPTLLAGLAVVTVSMVLLSIVGSFPSFIAVGIVYGAGYSFLFPTLSSMVVESSKPHERATASSMFHVMFTQGVVAGAFIFSLLAQHTSYATGLRASACVPAAFLLGVPILWRRREG